MSINTGKGFPMKLHFVGEGIVGYRRYMLFKQYLNTISHSKIIQEKLVLIKFFDKWGARATYDAYGVSRSTVYEWKKRYRKSKYNPNSLLPLSKRPKSIRKSNLDSLIIDFIKKLRSENYRLGKSKIKVLLDEYCIQNKLPIISESLVGKIIKKNRYFYPPIRQYHNPGKRYGKRRIKRKRIETRYKARYPGEIVQVDSITIFKDGISRYLITGVDLYSRFAFSYTYKSLSSSMALDFMQKFNKVAPFKISSVKTDNGHEFLGHFEKYLKDKDITQYFSYPRTPKSNAYVERFNRTIQEEFVEPNMDLIYDTEEFNGKLMNYLVFFNAVRPHRSLDNLTPMGYLVFKGILSSMCVTHTCN